MSEERTTAYFSEHGPANTEEVLARAARRAEELGIKHIVVASYSGDTGLKAVKALKGRTVVVVAGTFGRRKPNACPMPEEGRKAIEEAGGSVLFAGHAFGMMGRAVRRKLGAIQVDEIIAHVLRVFGHGLKVACEITCMAADAGLIPAGEECIAIGGTESGADAAIVIKASNTHTFFETRVCEIICKPR